MQLFKLSRQRGSFFPSLLPLKTRTFSWGGQSVQWRTSVSDGGMRTSEGLCLSSLHMSFMLPMWAAVLSSLFSRGWKQWIKVSLKSHHLNLGKTAYKLLSSLFDLYYPGIPEHHFLFSPYSVYAAEYPNHWSMLTHTAVKVIQGLRPVPGHKFKFNQSPDGKSHDCQSLFSKQDLLCNKSGHGQEPCQTSVACWCFWRLGNKVPEDLHGDKELNSSKVAYLPMILINMQVNAHITLSQSISQYWEILQYPNRGSRGGLSSLYISSMYICISAVPQEFTRLKMEEPLFGKDLASDLWDGSYLGQQAPPAPYHHFYCFCLKSVLTSFVYYAPFPHLFTSAPGAT